MINDLQSLNVRRASIESMRTDIQTLEARYTAIKSASYDATPVADGSNKRDEALVDNIVRREQKKQDMAITSQNVELIDSLLATLTDDEYKVIDAFYINRRKHHVDFLCEALNVEVATVYRIKNRAIQKLLQTRYGIMTI